MRSHNHLQNIIVVLVCSAFLLACKKKNVNIRVGGSCPGSECEFYTEPQVTPCENLVVNGSFEQTVISGDCPTTYSQVDKCVGLTLPTAATADYFRCCGKSKVDAPENHFGVQYPFSGRAYVGGGISSTSKDYMEYIQLQLKAPLVVGNVYKVSLRVSLSDNSRNSYGPLGVAAVEHKVSEKDYNLASTVPPSIEFPDLVTDKDCWELLEGTFVADNPSNFIIIGVFRRIKDMDRVGTGSTAKNPLFKCYFFYDDVKLECM